MAIEQTHQPPPSIDAIMLATVQTTGVPAMKIMAKSTSPSDPANEPHVKKARQAFVWIAWSRGHTFAVIAHYMDRRQQNVQQLRNRYVESEQERIRKSESQRH